ncbi:hypothetical protein NDU88_001744 [Pleurodeles waltl]|uniref:Uncharacterized protein n=1 Tax=Pleurodeles waltl TaxID=8319 RepID=A0AAV7P528_PLEWA|nr:hypothetical protein NDU88_001744 [Pleurodeles waltl]
MLGQARGIGTPEVAGGHNGEKLAKEHSENQPLDLPAGLPGELVTKLAKLREVAFPTVRERSKAPDGRHHMGDGRETQHGEFVEENARVMHEVEEDDEVELDYEDDSDDWEEGKVHDAEVSKVTVGFKGCSNCATPSSVDVLQMYSVDKGAMAGGRKEDRVRCRKVLYEQEKGPNSKWEW